MAEQQTEGNVDAAPVNGSPADEQQLRAELESAQRTADEHRDKYLRARADMENYKKRIERTYADLARSSKKELLNKLLQVKDNLERALSYSSGTSEGSEGIIQGVRLTEYQLNQILEQEGVTRIDAEGKPFDPSHEEALQSVHDPSAPNHVVVQVVRQGYMYGDEVLRPAQVIVNVHDTGE
jgi:molecular chaperone GrpE